jgi:hypothetical protein
LNTVKKPQTSFDTELALKLKKISLASPFNIRDMIELKATSCYAGIEHSDRIRRMSSDRDLELNVIAAVVWKVELYDDFSETESFVDELLCARDFSISAYQMNIQVF